MKEYDISIRDKPSSDELLKLFNQTEWAKNRNSDSVEKLLGNLNQFVAVYSDERLVGFGRAISDGIYRALIEDVIVDSEIRGAGLGKQLLRALLDQLDEVEEIFLNTGESLTEFYSGFGFRTFNGATMVKRKRNESWVER